VLVLERRVLDGSENILALKEWVICENLFEACTSAQEAHKINNTDSQVTNTRAPAAFFIAD
jgi:hypothetical protein